MGVRITDEEMITTPQPIETQYLHVIVQVPPMIRFIVRSAVFLALLFCSCVFMTVWIGRGQHSPLLAFVSDRTGTNQIYAQDLSTGILIQATDGSYNSSHPEWGASGSLLYASYPAPLRIAVFNLINRQLQILESGSSYDEYEPALSPNGYLAVATNPNLNWDIALYNPDYTPYSVTFNTPSNELEPCWWNANQLSFVSNRTGLNDIYLYDLATANLINLTDYPADDYNPACSTHGRLAFTSTRDFNAEVYVMDIATGAVQNVTDNPASDFNPAWLPDGRLSFVSDREGNREIYVLDLDTGALANITQNPANDDQPAWSK